MLWFLKKIPPDKIFPRSFMDFEQKYQKDPGMNRVTATLSILSGQIKFAIWNVQIVIDYSCNEQSICLQVQPCKLLIEVPW